MTEANTFGNFIRSKLYQGICPGQGARGELALIDFQGLSQSGREFYGARLYVWDDKVTGREVAAWFKEAGAKWVEINEQIHDEHNSIFEGRCSDGVRSWDINFTTDPEPTTAPPLTICRAEYEWRGQNRSLPAQDLLDALALECPPAPMTLTITIKRAPNPAAEPQVGPVGGQRGEVRDRVELPFPNDPILGSVGA